MTAAQRLRHLAACLQPLRRTQIVDVGARETETPPYQILLDLDLAELWGFEPEKEAYDALVAQARPHEHYMRTAVGDGTVRQLHVCYGRGFTSILRPSKAFLRFLGRWQNRFRIEYSIDLPTVRLDDIDEIRQIDLLKIDIQGGEHLVFENAVQKLSSTLAVVTECAAVPMYEGQPTMGDQIVALESAGLSLHKFLFFKQRQCHSPQLNRFGVHRFRNQMIDGDLAFLRSLLTPEKISDEQLKHMALIADAVLESYDVVVNIMNILEQRGVCVPDDINKYAKFFN
jgi:FkbM family methyltransferase